ncbi:hypothetical protein CCP2SC5_1020016 [Azospirillaceae bacterium]
MAIEEREHLQFLRQLESAPVNMYPKRDLHPDPVQCFLDASTRRERQPP